MTMLFVTTMTVDDTWCEEESAQLEIW